MEKIISELQNDFEKKSNKLSITNLVKLLKYTSNKYYNETQVISDEQYDLLYDLLKKKSPNNKFFNNIGADVSSNDKVKLPYHMGSMDKKKPNTGEVDSWIKKYKDSKYIISDKLDGDSILFVVNDGEKNLYTRGNGSYGRDISHLIEFFPEFNRDFEIENFAVRGEFIISKDNFKKYKDKFSNARSMLNGLIIKKNVSKDDISIIDFIAYEYVSNMKYQSQLKQLKQMDFNLVKAMQLKEINDDILSKLLEKRRKKSLYDIDGLIITNNKANERNTSGNPKYAFAFKDTSLLESKIVDVIEVEWNISKDDLLKPRIKIKPIQLSGVEINYVTGFNGKYIEDNKIGKDSKLEIIRSGDVIPHIKKVIKLTKADMPKMKYKWSDSKVDIIVDEVTDDIKYTKLLKYLTYFFKTIGIKNIDSKTLEKIINSKLDTLPKILKAKEKDFLNIEGFQETMANKIYLNIQNKIKDVKLPVLMTASNIFGKGFGVKKFNIILKEYPTIITKNYNEDKLIELVIKLEGFEKKTAIKFAKGVPKFILFLKSVPMIKIQKEKQINIGTILQDKKIVFSGFRDKELEELIEIQGGKVVGTISKNTAFLIVKDKDESSSKITKAEELKVKILSKTSFIKKFKL